MTDAGPDGALLAGLRDGDRRALARAITLVESACPDHRARAQALLDALLPATGGALRIGISGAPGVGKSTFIETLGLHLVGLGHRVAVLAVDPSSRLSGGSILGDKTRMAALARSPAAFIRPSPAGTTPGGVAGGTREALLLCEAAGFDVVLVETLGVGQAETAVAGMTDLMVLLQLPIAGDGLQALKKGILEVADLVVINKADLAPVAAAEALVALQGALAIRYPGAAGWHPRVLALSALDGQGIPGFWSEVERCRRVLQASGVLAERRGRQALDWMWQRIEERLRADFRAHPRVAEALPALGEGVRAGTLSPAQAAERLLAAYGLPQA